ncbi:hypothetical protein DPMN_073317 [Dreissena polymorpha]|uniref:Uncharacterized protein n=1 Tax=Dreissena polymorpha TaxID=45954 RepID=A0A9D4BYT9_DREPO|nr:hypothetical protein DPMN_073317 [Dreissena polymorpha]
MSPTIVAQNIIGTNLLTKLHEDRKMWPLEKNALPLAAMFLKQPASFLNSFKDIIGINLLTKFHDDRTVNVASRVLTRFYYNHIRKNAPLLGSNFFQANIIIFELIQDIIETNLLTKFHEDWTLNVASRVLTRFYYSHILPYKEKCPAPCGHVFKATKTIFELIQDIIGTNLLTKFHDDRKMNVTSRVLTRKIAPHPWWPYIIRMNLLTKFHEDWTINVASRVKNAPPLGGHVFHANVTIFKLIQDIIKTNLLTIFHQDWTINVASRVLTRKNAPPPGGHVFQPTGIIFKLIQANIGMNLLTKKNAPPLGSHVFQEKVTIFQLIQDISGTNLLSKFHEDQKINVASRVLTRLYYSHIRRNVFQPTSIIFELVQGIIRINLLTKFQDDQTINVASRVKNATTLGSHVFQANVTIFELIQDIIETNLLTK